MDGATLSSSPWAAACLLCPARRHKLQVHGTTKASRSRFAYSPHSSNPPAAPPSRQTWASVLPGPCRIDGCPPRAASPQPTAAGAAATAANTKVSEGNMHMLNLLDAQQQAQLQQQQIQRKVRATCTCCIPSIHSSRHSCNSSRRKDKTRLCPPKRLCLLRRCILCAAGAKGREGRMHRLNLLTLQQQVHCKCREGLSKGLQVLLAAQPHNATQHCQGSNQRGRLKDGS
eukprot:1154756-Pelagomonas_calceolata.AAC.4